MSKYYIKTNFGYQIVEGHKSKKVFGFHKKDKGNYVITDLASGLSIVEGLKSIAACNKYVEDEKNLSDIEIRKKNRDNYTELVKTLKKYSKEHKIKDAE